MSLTARSAVLCHVLGSGCEGLHPDTPRNTTRPITAGPTPARTMTFQYPRSGWRMHHYSRPGEFYAQCMSPWRGGDLELERPRRWRPVDEETPLPDRTIDVWGQRTPTAPGSSWAPRVDQHLEDGVGEGDVDRWVRSACVLCSNGCGLDIAVKDGRMVGVRGREHDRVNHGRLGPKGLYGSTPWANAEDRLRTPLVRNSDGELEQTDWDTAMRTIVAHSRQLLEERG